MTNIVINLLCFGVGGLLVAAIFLAVKAICKKKEHQVIIDEVSTTKRDIAVLSQELAEFISNTSMGFKNISIKFDTLKDGVLSLQGDKFKHQCSLLLEQETAISENQYLDLANEHKIYNSLGGNHDGDYLFSLVEEKYKNQVL